jgi:hypothetical protein
MADADQSPSEADPEPTAHAHDAPGLSPKQFLLRVMHAPDAAIRDRIRAASTLLRLYPHDWDPPAFTYRIGGIPHCHSLSTASSSSSAMERTGINSQKKESARITLKHSRDSTGSPIDEEIPDHLTLCSRCGEFVFYPCTKAPLN